MAKPQRTELPAAAPPPEVVRVMLELHLKPEDYAALLETQGVAGSNDLERVRNMAARLLVDQARGGLMIDPRTMQHIQEATGLDPATGEDLLPYLSAATGREEGRLTLKVHIDPEYELALANIAQGRGVTSEELFDGVVQQVLDNGWWEIVDPAPEHVLMNSADKAQLEDLLGGKFTTGRDLVGLIRRVLGNPVEAEVSDAA